MIPTIDFKKKIISLAVLTSISATAQVVIDPVLVPAGGSFTLNEGELITGTITNGAIEADGDNTTVVINGDIATSDTTRAAYIRTDDGGHSFTLNGNITAPFEGVLITGDNNRVFINGSIVTGDRNDSRALNLSNASNTSLELNGWVASSGLEARALQAPFGRSNIVINGTVRAAGEESKAVSSWAFGSSLTINGLVTATGENSIALWVVDGAIQSLDSLAGSSESIYLPGTIIASGVNARAIDMILGSGNIYISGLVDAGSGVAINIVAGANNNIFLKEGARIIGSLVTGQENPEYSINNTLVFDLGATQSYVFNTTGNWILEDLDGRAVVSGSAMAAGIGNAEAADELQYQRLANINQSLLSQIFSVGENVQRQAWIEPVAFDTDRKAGHSDPTVEDFSLKGQGFTIGLPLTIKGRDTDVLLGAQHSKLNIHNGVQSIDTTSLYSGLYFRNFSEIGNVRFSGKALLGYNQYDMDRQVLVNANTSTGMTHYKAKYSGWEAVTGVEAQYSRPLGNGATVMIGALGADLVFEKIESFQETAHFRWRSRNLLQGVAKASLGLRHDHGSGLQTYAIASVQARDVLGGKTTHYAINGVDVQFAGGDFNDTTSQINIGALYKVKDAVSLALSAQTSTSKSKGDSKSVSARFNWQF